MSLTFLLDPKVFFKVYEVCDTGKRFHFTLVFEHRRVLQSLLRDITSCYNGLSISKIMSCEDIPL